MQHQYTTPKPVHIYTPQIFNTNFAINHHRKHQCTNPMNKMPSETDVAPKAIYVDGKNGIG